MNLSKRLEKWRNKTESLYSVTRRCLALTRTSCCANRSVSIDEWILQTSWGSFAMSSKSFPARVLTGGSLRLTTVHHRYERKHHPISRQSVVRALKNE